MENSTIMTLRELLSIYGVKKVYLLACATNGLTKSSKLLAIGMYEIFPGNDMQIMYINRADSDVQENSEYHKISTDMIHKLGEDEHDVTKKFDAMIKDCILLTYNAGFQHQFLAQISEYPETITLYDWTIVEKATRNNLVLNNADIATFPDFMHDLERRFDSVPLNRYINKNHQLAPGQTTLEQRLSVSYDKFYEVLSRDFEVLQS